MKKLFFLSLLISVCVSATANDNQKVNPEASAVKQDKEAETKPEQFFFRRTFGIGYHQMTLTSKSGSDTESSDVKGFSTEIIFMKPLYNNIISLYGGFTYNGCSKSESDQIKVSDSETRNISSDSWYSNFKIPVGFQLNLILSERVCISPFIGVNANIGISARQKIKTITHTTTYDDSGWRPGMAEQTKYKHTSTTENETKSMYDHDKFGDYTWKRFQFGFDTGAKIALGYFYLYGAYSKNFTDQYKKDKMSANLSSFTFGLGFIF